VQWIFGRCVGSCKVTELHFENSKKSKTQTKNCCIKFAKQKNDMTIRTSSATNNINNNAVLSTLRRHLQHLTPSTCTNTNTSKNFILFFSIALLIVLSLLMPLVQAASTGSIGNNNNNNNNNNNWLRTYSDAHNTLNSHVNLPMKTSTKNHHTFVQNYIHSLPIYNNEPPATVTMMPYSGNDAQRMGTRHAVILGTVT